MAPAPRYRNGSARMPGWDYRNYGRYFITICTTNRICFFGDCANSNLRLSAIGKIALEFWKEIPVHFPNASLDVFVVMPNHIHGIIALTGEKIESRNADMIGRNLNTGGDQNEKDLYFQAISPKAGSISAIIRSYKAVCKKDIHQKFPDAGFAWQPRFHDHIIRNDDEYYRIRNYIINNPRNWTQDKFFGATGDE